WQKKFIYVISRYRHSSTHKLVKHLTGEHQMKTTKSTTWTVDSTHADVGFAVRHLMISTVRGRFGAMTGTVSFDESKPADSKVDVTIDVASIDTRQEQRDA